MSAAALQTLLRARARRPLRLNITISHGSEVTPTWPTAKLVHPIMAASPDWSPWERGDAAAESLQQSGQRRQEESRPRQICAILSSVFVACIQNAWTKPVKLPKKQRDKDVDIISGITKVSRGVMNFLRERRNSRDKNVSTGLWINTTLAMFRPLPWPSLTEVSCAFCDKTDFLF